MWKRNRSVKTTSTELRFGRAEIESDDTSEPTSRGSRQQGRGDFVTIGKSVVVKGELTGNEDVTIEGQVEGKIELKDHVLTIGVNGKVKAQVFAKTLVVLGELNGNVATSEKVEIRDSGSVNGEIVSPRVAIEEGAHFRGSVDMQRKSSQATMGPQSADQPAPQVPLAEQVARSSIR